MFVHGCFWHAHAECRYAAVPATRRDFWQQKLAANRARDQSACEALLAEGWRVLVVWECATRPAAMREALRDRLSRWIEGNDVTGEFGSSPP